MPDPLDLSQALARTDPQRADLFLSYHHPDRDRVVAVRQQLEARGLSTFLDRDSLRVGRPWPEALEEALRNASAVAVFLGPHGLGTWQKREMWFALERQAQEERAGRAFPVIPVLLSPDQVLSGFLASNTALDLTRDTLDPAALDRLADAARGSPPQILPAPMRLRVYARTRGWRHSARRTRLSSQGGKPLATGCSRSFDRSRSSQSSARQGVASHRWFRRVWCRYSVSSNRQPRPGTSSPCDRAPAPFTSLRLHWCHCWSPVSERSTACARPASWATSSAAAKCTCRMWLQEPSQSRAAPTGCSSS